MKANENLCTFWIMVLAASLILSATGCATQTGRSYNQDFNQSLTSDPKYLIENIDDDHFKLTIDQGSAQPGPQRIVEMKNAAPNIAEAEARRRGWDSWQLDYIQERDQGWMHILIADVTHKTSINMPPDHSKDNP